jgi:hypothetical protein
LTGTAVTSQFSFVIDQCTGLKLTSAYSGVVQGSNFTEAGKFSSFLLQSGDTSGEFRMEQRNGITEWDPNASPTYPLLSSLLPDGSSGWSLRTWWLNTNGPSKAAEFRAATLRQINRLSTATRTITLEMFMRSALISALVNYKIALVITYYNGSTGKAVTEVLTGIPVSSSASWTNAGSWSGYGAYKIALTTANTVKQYSEITMRLAYFDQPGTAQNESIFLDPEFSVA